MHVDIHGRAAPSNSSDCSCAGKPLKWLSKVKVNSFLGKLVWSHLKLPPYIHHKTGLSLLTCYSSIYSVPCRLAISLVIALFLTSPSTVQCRGLHGKKLQPENNNIYSKNCFHSLALIQVNKCLEGIMCHFQIQSSWAILASVFIYLYYIYISVLSWWWLLSWPLALLSPIRRSFHVHLNPA